MTVRREIVLKLVYLCCSYIKENHFYTILLHAMKNSFFKTIESVRHNGWIRIKCQIIIWNQIYVNNNNNKNLVVSVCWSKDSVFLFPLQFHDIWSIDYGRVNCSQFDLKRDRQILMQANAWPPFARITCLKLHELYLETSCHPPYFPHVAPSDLPFILGFGSLLARKNS